MNRPLRRPDIEFLPVTNDMAGQTGVLPDRRFGCAFYSASLVSAGARRIATGLTQSFRDFADHGRCVAPFRWQAPAMKLCLLECLALALVSAETTAQSAWQLEPEIRIGEVDGAGALSNILDIVVSPSSGLIFVSNTDQIKVFGPDGRYLRQIGRKGPGPGEFTILSRISWLDGDIVATDFQAKRLTRFTEEGVVVDSRQMQFPTSDTFLSVQLLAPLRDEAVLGLAARPAMANPELQPLVWLGASGELKVIDELDISTQTVPLLGPNQERGRLFRSINSSSLQSVDPLGSGVVIVHQPTPLNTRSTDFRVRKLDANGLAIFARSYSFSPRRLPTEVADSIVDLRQGFRRQMGWDDRELRAALGLTAFQPPVTDLLLGVDGTIWIRREGFGEELVEYWVLDPRGDPIGRLSLPRRAKLLYADRDFVWGLEFDRLDVPYAVRYRVLRGV